jgi:hypothetical protein
MAVVQISKIQLRRGQKNSQSGIPQLSSAEMAWAVDTQELFIGNGSVAEGAPYVGNTKILTEHDNILELIEGYRFGNDDPSIINSVTRSLQSKLDEYVSIADYGVVSDGSTDCTDQFEKAFTELFRNVDESYRKTLLIPNGVYLFIRDLEIPANAKIKGESREGAIFSINDNNIRLISADGTSSGFTSTNRPENILLTDITIQRTSGQVVLTGLKNGTFNGVKFLGDHFLGRPISSLPVEPSAVFWENNSPGTIVSNLHFNNCLFDTNSISVKCLQSIKNKSDIFFVDSYFQTGNTFIYINGIEEQDNSWKIFNCKFQNSEYSAFRSTNGRNTLIESSKFINCGNDVSDVRNPVTNIVFFGETRGNLVIDSSFDRQQSAGIVNSSSVLSIPEVYNGSFVNIIDRIYSTVSPSDNTIPLTILSSYNRYIYIRYILTLGNFSRSGTLSLTVNESKTFVGITDDYVYSDDLLSSPGGTVMSNFEFVAKLKNNGFITDIETVNNNETIVIEYRNPPPSFSGSITFDVTYGV